MKKLVNKVLSLKSGIGPKVVEVKEYLQRVYPKVLSIAISFSVSASMAFADVSADGESEWQAIVGLIAGWLVKAAGAYLLYGVFIAAKGYKSHNPEAKDDGIDNIVTSCIAIAGISVVKKLIL